MPAKSHTNQRIQIEAQEYCFVASVQPESGKKPLYRFKASDERINLNGYKIITKGIDLARFKDNSVVFFNHDTWDWPIALVKNSEKIGEDFFVDIEFHGEDEQSQRAERLVAAGVLKYVSIGARIIECSEEFDSDSKQQYLLVTKCQLREISLTPLPANLGAGLQEVLAASENEISDDDRQWLLSSVSTRNTVVDVHDDVSAGDNNDNNIHNQRTSMDAAKLLEENAGLKINLSAAETELASLKASAAESVKTIDELKAKLASSEKESADAKTSIEAANAQLAEAKKLVAAAEVKTLIIELGDKVTPAENSADNKFKLEANLVHLKLNEDTMKNAFGESLYSEKVLELKARTGNAHLRAPIGADDKEIIHLAANEINLSDPEHKVLVDVKAKEIAKTKNISYMEALSTVVAEGF